MSIQTTFNKSIQGTNNIYGDMQSTDNATFNNITCSLVRSDISNNLNFGTNNIIRWYIHTNGDILSNGAYNINSNGNIILNQYASTYQKKCLFSSTGQLTNTPTWTTALNQPAGTFLDFDIGNNTTFPYFDNTNFKKHIIHFQAYVNFNSQALPKWTCRLYLLTNNVVQTDVLENSINEINRTAPTTLVALDSTNIYNYVTIMSNIEVTDTFDFTGRIEINNTFGGYQEFKVDCCYNKSTIGSTNSFGCFRSTVKTTNYNGIRLNFPTTNGFHRLNIRYYVEST